MTTAHQIEIRALRVVDRVINSSPAEDDLVECKAEWPDNHRKAARQIAALCNAARGEDSMWLVGVNEKQGKVVPASVNELANWWPQVEKYFGDRISPEMQNLVVPTPEGDIVALNFGTGRAPYLVSANGEGGIDFEVPIRAGNRTRTARRHELILMMSEETDAPIIELVNCKIYMHMPSDAELSKNQVDPGNIRIQFTGFIFVSTVRAITIPAHRMKAVVSFPNLNDTAELDLSTGASFSTPQETTAGFRKLASGFYFDAPDGVNLHASGEMPRSLFESIHDSTSISILLEFHIAGRERPVQVRKDLSQDAKTERRGISNIRTTRVGNWTGQSDI
ncbi:hypothetical protein [Rhodococcus sp. AQ5-07]|uniref:hypothetical protein n=1 Tax=Rhodococcus sp. AQ5-07 TaxID=2054902 RepID=UPI0012B52A76|nr:hypothetical protein [Rhodococcus sp. AQ5-07]